jgi:aminoglycoside 6'-N-acetyltransferase
LRPLARGDFLLLAAWLARPHVARWWNHEASPAAVERDFGAVVDGTDPAEIFIAAVDGRPFGLVQRYTFADNPDYLDELAPLLAVPPGALSIDYFVGEDALLRCGLGAGMVHAAVQGAWDAYPAAPAVIVPVAAANRASWRLLERVGFTCVAQGPLVPDNPIDDPAHLVYRIDRPKSVDASRPRLAASARQPPSA